MKVSLRRKLFAFMANILFLVLSMPVYGADTVAKINVSKGKMYRHVTGLKFWYPHNWQVRELEEALQLIPDQVETTAKGPAEIYFVSGESIAGTGIRNPDDPQVIQYTDQVVQSMLPTL